MARAVRAWQSGQLGEAEAVLNTILRQTPQQAEAAHLLGVVLHQSGRTAAGIQAIERALALNPNAAPFHANLAKLYRVVGDTARAIQHGRRAVALKPDRTDAHVDLGLALIDAGDVQEALEQFEAVLRRQPMLVEAINGRGTALRVLGRTEEAEAAFQKALSLRPNYPEALNNLGTVLRAQGRADEAEKRFRQALTIRPSYLLAANNLILALKDLRRYDDAIAVAREVLRVAPQNADTLALMGSVYLDNGQAGAALDALRKAATIDPSKAERANMLGGALVSVGRTEEAIAEFRRALELNPLLADAHNNLGNALRDLGKFDEALAEFETAIKLQPDATGVYINIADVKKFRSSEDVHLAAMEALMPRIGEFPLDAQTRLHFALGKAYDDLKRFDEAFEQFRQGNTLQRQSIVYDEQGQLDVFARTQAVFSPGLIAGKAGAGCRSALPIFVIGMPRSGTTLLEQIISSHSQVKGAGETLDLMLAISAVQAGMTGALPYPELVTGLTPAELTRIGEEYVRRLSARAPGAPHVVDKLPTNFHFLGFIYLALPNAKVVHIRRNPLDTCLSCFSKMFTGPQNHTYDLGELGRYWRAYDALMAYWRRVLPEEAFLDVEYEQLTRDIESETRRIFDFCGLPFEAEALSFERKDGTVRTASSYQVRQPLYTTAVERWRHYERHLGPLKEALRDP